MKVAQRGWSDAARAKAIAAIKAGRRTPRRMSLEERCNRFWSKVPVRIEGQCWPFSGYKVRKGYGRFCFDLGGGFKSHLAHRIAFYLTHGEVPALLRHTCDNPPCCNPDHLIPGTVKQNAEDAAERGLIRRGEEAPFAKLTDEKVIEIRRAYAAGALMGDLAKAHGISQGNISNAIRGITWSHIPGAIAAQRKPLRQKEVLATRDAQIVEFRQVGVFPTAIAEAMGVSKGVVDGVLRKHARIRGAVQ